jgi:hypothetical protein
VSDCPRGGGQPGHGTKPPNATSSPRKSPLFYRKLPSIERAPEGALWDRTAAAVSRDLMKRAVAYRIQERLLGGLSVSTRRLLERTAEDAVARRPARPRRRAAKVRRRLHQAGVQHGSLLLTAPPRREIRTPNPRRVFDVTGFRASAWRTKRTTNSLQHRCFYSGRILRRTQAEFRPNKP